MAHNGNRSQLNLWFLNFGGEFAFINAVHNGGGWTNGDNSAFADINAVGSTGLPVDTSTLGGDGVYHVFRVPDQDARPGNWILKWTGTITGSRRNFDHTIVSGSASGTNGRCVMSLDGATDTTSGGLRIDLGPSGVRSSDPLTEWAFYHEDDEDAYLAGEVFAADFKAVCARYGVLRFLDWNVANSSPVTKWEHRKPVNYFSYAASEYRHSLYRGTTSNVGDAYTLDLGDGGTPADKDFHIIKFNATASTNSSTLNGVPFLLHNGDVISFSSQRPTANRITAVSYDADLGGWLKGGGDSENGNIFLRNGVPYEIMLRLCEEVGAHPWINLPHLTLDPMSDFTTGLCAYIRDNHLWMIPRIEPGNEEWNFGAGFEPTRYGWNKAQVRAGWGGADFQTNDHYGRVLSLCGQAVSAVYGDDRSRYHVIAGHQAATFSAPSAARLSGKHVSVDGGSAASNWATAISFASYWDTGHDAAQLTNAAYQYSLLGTDEERVAYISDFWASAPNRDGSQLDAMAEAWVAYAEGLGMACLPYEGGFGFDGVPSGGFTSVISGATKAAQCVLTFPNPRKPPVGSSITISGVGGMTELNGNTYEVVSVVGLAVTIDVNSTSFTTYTTGGSALYVDSDDYFNPFMYALKYDPQLEDVTRRINGRLWRNGVRDISSYVLSGNNAWSLYYPTLYDRLPSAIGSDEFSTSATPLRFTFNLS